MTTMHDIDLDQLNQLWREGHEVTEIARRMGFCRSTIGNRISKMRDREGTERWPRRIGIIEKQRLRREARKAKPLPEGATTLPPLPSLTEV